MEKDEMILTEPEKEIFFAQKTKEELGDFVRNHPEKDSLRLEEMLEMMYPRDNKLSDSEHSRALKNILLALKYVDLPPSFNENTIVELDFPSGKVITADSLFDFVPDANFDDSFNFNSGFGMDKYSRAIAKERDLGYVFVGNSCPSINRQKDGSFKIVREAFAENDQGDDEPVYEDGEEKVATIITNLWAVSMIDYDKWLAYGGEDIAQNPPNLHGSHSDGYYSVFDVTPGKYRLTIYSNSESFDRDAERTEYAKLELIEQY